MDILNCYFSYILICQFLYIVSSRLQQYEIDSYLLNIEHITTLFKVENKVVVVVSPILDYIDIYQLKAHLHSCSPHYFTFI